MQQHYRPFEYRVLDEFPNARLIRGWEGGSCHIAEQGGRHHAILDSRTLADFVDDDERAELVKVITFDTDTERDAFLRDALPGATTLVTLSAGQKATV